MPSSESLTSPTALNALQGYLETFDRITADRGGKYFRQGHVGPIHADDSALSAVVQGSIAYDVVLEYADDLWIGDCTCPVEADCKHCYALALAWRSRHLPGQKTAPTAAGVVKAGKKSFREQWAPVAAAKLGRALTTDEARQLGHLSALFQEMRQHWGRLHASSLRNHHFDPPALAATDSYGWVYGDWWDQQQPPADPWALWQYLAYDYERAGRPVPEVFRPFTDTTRVRSQLEARLEEKELHRWRTHLGAPDTARAFLPEKSIHGLRLRHASPGRWLIEIRPAPEKPFKEATQKWLRSLGTTVTNADFATLPAPDRLLGSLLILSRSSVYGYDQSIVDDDLIEAALAQPAIHPALALTDGTPIQFADNSLAWQAALDPQTPGRIHFTLVDASRQPADDATLFLPGPAPLYLWKGKLVPGPQPLPLKNAPLRLLEETDTRQSLRARAILLPDSLTLKFRHLSARAVLECDLVEDIGTVFRARLLSCTDEPPSRRQWSGSGWHWLDGYAPPARLADGSLPEIDHATATAAAATFADFRLGWHHLLDGWTRSASRNFPEEFLAWHARLPPGIELKTSPQLAGLLGAPLKAHADFSAIPAEGSGMDWFDLTLSLRVEDTTLTPDEISLLLKARGKWVQLPRHGWQRLEFAATGDALAALDRLGLNADELLEHGRPATHRLHALQLAGEADALAARDATLADTLRQRVAALRALPAPELPATLRATLRPYQLEGYHFLAHLSAHGFGGVLADDMGLGKTVQTLAWLLHLVEKKPPAPNTSAGPAASAKQKKPARIRKKATAPDPGPSPLASGPSPSARPFRALIVCPKSVIHGWQSEAARFAPGIAAIPFTPAHTDAATPPGPADAPALLLAHYTQLRLHADWFKQHAWDAVVLDEAQFIKNPGSQTAVVARALPTAHRLALTGTPIENRLLDLWSLFAFAQPGLLGTQAAFKRQHPDASTEAHARLRRRVRHFMLRRTKVQVATDLPARTEDEIVVDLEDQQRRLYEAELKRARAQLLGVQTDRALDAVRFNILASLLRLRQICCHPALIDPAYRDAPSAKLDALLERLSELRDEGHQVLVFSQFVEMLEIIRERLLTEKIGHLMLTGQTENRAELVEKFQTDRTQTVFLLSLKAAGSGLNLTAASYVVLYDPWWNPAVEAQAIDRTHRIGQTQPVVAYRLLASGSIEEKIRRLQRDKAALATAVVQEESLARVLDLDSLREILA